MSDDSLSDEDKALFRDHMRGVNPLNKNNTKIPTEKPKPSPRPRKNPDPLPTQTYFLSDYITDTILAETILSYAHPSIPHRRMQELKKGQIPWQGRIDLHGLTTEAAREALCTFIQNQSQQDKRCLLIIHGKGMHQGTPPVIKNLVNRWLPQLEEVLAFHSAQPKDGGAGAVYVLLKKQMSFE